MQTAGTSCEKIEVGVAFLNSTMEPIYITIANPQMPPAPPAPSVPLERSFVEVPWHWTPPFLTFLQHLEPNHWQRWRSLIQSAIHNTHYIHEQHYGDALIPLESLLIPYLTNLIPTLQRMPQIYSECLTQGRGIRNELNDYIRNHMWSPAIYDVPPQDTTGSPMLSPIPSMPDSENDISLDLFR